MLPPAAIATVTRRYVGHDVTFTELGEMLGELNALYAKRGYVTARALLPAQTVENDLLAVERFSSTMGTPDAAN